MTLEPLDLLIAARSKLIRRYPFWGYATLHLRFKESKEVPTIGVLVDGTCLYNPEFVKANKDHLTFILAHEVGHLLLEHHKRQGKRNIVVTTIDPFTKKVNSTLLYNIACVEKGTQILMEDGSTKKIEDLKTNDWIIGYEEGKLVPALVLNKLRRESEENLIIETDKRRLVCSKDHPILLSNGSFIEAKGLKRNMEIIVVDRNDFPNKVQVERGGVRLSGSELYQNDLSRKSKSFRETRVSSSSKDKSFKTEGKTDREENFTTGNREINKLGKRPTRLSSGYYRWRGYDSHKKDYEKILYTDNRSLQYQPLFDGLASESLSGQANTSNQCLWYSLVTGPSKRLFNKFYSREVNSLSDSEKASSNSNMVFNQSQKESYAKRQVHRRDERDLSICERFKLKRERVKRVEKVKGKRVLYDLVTSAQTFIANDIVVHNCDYALNLLLSEHFTIPDYALLDERFRGKVAEEIYDELKRELKNKIQRGKGKSNIGQGNFDSHVWIYDEANELGIEETTGGESLSRQSIRAKDWSKIRNEAIAWSEKQGKSKGDIPEGLEREIEDFIDVRFDWRHLLRKAMINLLKNDYCLEAMMPILLPDGSYKPIKDLEIGDRIVGYKDGTLVESRVLQKFAIPEVRNVYSVNGIICSGDHKFLTECGYLRAKDIFNKVNDVSLVWVEPYEEETLGFKRQILDRGRRELVKRELLRGGKRGNDKEVEKKLESYKREGSANGIIERKEKEKDRINSEAKGISGRSLRWRRVNMFHEKSGWEAGTKAFSLKLLDKAEQRDRKSFKEDRFPLQEGKTNKVHPSSELSLGSFRLKRKRLSTGDIRLLNSKEGSGISNNLLLHSERKVLQEERSERDERNAGASQIEQGTKSLQAFSRGRGESYKFYDIETTTGNYIVGNLISHNSYLRPHRSYYSTGIYLPSMKKEEGIKLAVGVDSSGSITKEELTKALSLIKNICEEYKDRFVLYLMDCDSRLYNFEREVTRIEQFYEFTRKLKGKGGTDYRPIFRKIEEESLDIKLLIIIGDLMGDMPTERPRGYEVIWLVGEDGARPSSEWYERASQIGEVIYINNQ